MRRRRFKTNLRALMRKHMHQMAGSSGSESVIKLITSTRFAASIRKLLKAPEVKSLIIDISRVCCGGPAQIKRAVMRHLNGVVPLLADMLLEVPELLPHGTICPQNGVRVRDIQGRARDAVGVRSKDIQCGML